MLGIMKTSKILTTLFVCFGITMWAYTQQTSKTMATYIYNFTRFIEWPADYKNGNFIIGVIGETPVYSDLQQLMNGKNINKTQIEIKQFTENSDFSRCHILFVPSSKSANINYILKELTGYRTLIVCEKPGMIHKGSGISFREENSKLKFEINKTNIISKGLYVNSQLELLAANTPKPTENI
jgi:hypothetical protein